MQAWTRQDGSKKGAPLVLPLTEVVDGQRRLVGGKAANLAVLMRAQFPVPPGFCVTTAAFGDFLNSCSKRDELWRILSQLAAARPEQTTSVAERAAAWLADAPIRPQVEEAVLRQWREQGEERAYALRSSATVEDAADHSFAGQFASFLNVRGKGLLLDAIRKCWLSLFSTRALAYQAKNNVSPLNSAMAVVVQEMVPAEMSGVLFTIDPTTGDADRLVIEAGPGLGENVVAGRVIPDRVVLAKSSLAIVARTAGRRPESALALDDRTAQELARLSQRVEEVLTGPLDIEWAISGHSHRRLGTG